MSKQRTADYCRGRRDAGAHGLTRANCALAMLCLLIFTAAGHAGPAGAKPAASVMVTATGARLGGDRQRTRFVVDLTKAVGFNVFVLADPFRVIVDLPEINFQLRAGLGRTGRGLVTGYRYGRFAAGKSRIVLDAVSPVLIEKSFSIKAGNGQPARLVVDLVATDRKTFLEKRALSGAPPDRLARVARRQVKSPPTPRTRPRKHTKAARSGMAAKRVRRATVIIDPGHGGVDPGTIGRRGTAEKTVVLAFAKILKKVLDRTGRYKVVLTRKTDTFMRLKERIDTARRHNADLFIALHADSLKTGHVRGATVYTLSERASDREAAALAAKENRADIIAGVNLTTKSSEVTGILIDLAQRETKNHSVHFGRWLVKELRQVTSLAGNPHRFAGFRVLTAPDVPSVLLELGYLSSRRDEALLRSKKWRLSAATAVARAVENFFNARLAGRTL